ncbi:hypothetical protein PMAYCL1PPCAC_05003, partial [Pristionchus mayeri]
NCSKSDVSIRWWEKKREEGVESMDESVIAGFDGLSKTIQELKKTVDNGEEKETLPVHLDEFESNVIKRLLAGADPGAPGPAEPAVNEDPIHEGQRITVQRMPSLKFSHHRGDRSYMLPRPGYVIVRRQTNLVCQKCGECGFATCSSMDHHLRNVHKMGHRQADMWMHCGRCIRDFTNIVSVRDHFALEKCDWQSMFMCWHEKEGIER